MENKELVPVIQIVEGKIQDNLEALEIKVKAIAEQYKGLVVTDVKDAKDTLAKLRGLFKRINDEKIAAKKIFMAPFEEVERKVKEFGALLNEPIAEIDLQVKTAEQKIRDDRQAEIVSMLNQAASDFDPTMKEFFDSVSWRKEENWVQEKFWTSKGNPTTKLKEEIKEKAVSCKSGINTILLVAGEFTDQILEEFRLCGNLGKALAVLQEKKEVKARAEAVRKSLDEPLVVNTRQEPEQTPAFMQDDVEESPEDLPQAEPEIPAFMRGEVSHGGPQKKEVLIRFLCTDAEFVKVRTALSIAGVNYEVL